MNPPCATPPRPLEPLPAARFPRAALAVLALAFLPASAPAIITVSQPFAGVRYTHRTQRLPRPLSIHLLEIDLTHPQIRCLISPGNGATRGENTPRTVRQFVTTSRAQIGINASFFLSSAEGANYDNRGLVASAGEIYSPFDGDNRPWPVLNISADNFVQIVSQAVQPSTTTAVLPAIPLYNAVSGSERTVTNGRNTAGAVGYGEPQLLHPRTVAGVTPDRRLVLLLVDGRQRGVSEGMYGRELAELLIQYGVVDAVNLDGGGSTTLVFADPTPRVLNGASDGTERAVGASLGIFAAPATTPRDTLIYADFYAGDRAGFAAGPAASAGTQGVLDTSTHAAEQSLAAVARGWFQRLTLRDDPAIVAGWSARHAWNSEPENPARPTRGFIGFYARTTSPGTQAAIAVNPADATVRGIRRALIADGAWHLYEWNLERADDWETGPVSLARITGPAFTLDSIQFFGPDADAVIDLDLVAHNALGPLAPELLPANDGRFANLSVRTVLTAAAPALHLGISVAAPDAPLPLLVRAAGPALGTFGVTGTVADPRLRITDTHATLIAGNDNWAGAPPLTAAADRVGAFPLGPATSLDAAILTTVPAGNFFAEIAGAGTGIAVAEAYDASENAAVSTSRLVNLSTRSRTAPGDATLVAGFVVTSGTQRVLVRAIGPGLAGFGVAETLPDPQLAVYAGATLHALNDDWGGGPVLTDTFARVGAFELDPSSRDAAMVLTLVPGAYSVHVRGANDTSGTVLLELYGVR